MLRSAERKALVCYITAGFPDPSRSLELMKGLQDGGADVIEVGVPFSDPIADGPVIQDSSQRSLAAGMTLSGTLSQIADADLDVPVVLFTYINPLISAGPDVLSHCIDAGVDGVLVTDLPVGADAEREQWLGSSELAFIRLAAPTTPAWRMREIARNGSGFVYLISSLGVTGARDDLPADLPVVAARLRQTTELPVCIGFGISRPEQARAAAALADGVVVGSALVREADRGIRHALSLARSLRYALDS